MNEMERKEHIAKIKIISALCQGRNVSEVAKQSALEYARRVTTSPELQTAIRLMEHDRPRLGEWDIERCASVARKYTAPVEPQQSAHTSVPSSDTVKLKLTPVAELKKPRLTPKEIEELETHGILVYLGGQLVYTVRGEAWKAAGRPPLDTFVYKSERREPIAPPEDKLRVLIPYMDLNEQGGFVTFRRVPEDKRELIEQLRAMGILGRMNILTDKGKAWLNAA